jgi:hypothetical protein
MPSCTSYKTQKEFETEYSRETLLRMRRNIQRYLRDIKTLNLSALTAKDRKVVKEDKKILPAVFAAIPSPAKLRTLGQKELAAIFKDVQRAGWIFN